MARTTSIGRILKNDYPSLLMLMLVMVSWIVVAGLTAFGFLAKFLFEQPENAEVVESDVPTLLIFAAIAVGVTIIFGFYGWQRIRNLRRIVTTGPEVTGRVLAVSFQRDRGRVEYEYEYEAQTYKSGNAVWKNADTTALQQGDEVKLIVDPAHPTHAFLHSLYVTGNA